jgi:tape measure domain-containing protein
LVKIGADSSGLRKELQASQRQIKRAFGTEALAASQAAAGALAAVTAVIAGAGVASISLAGKLKMTEKAFETLTGSAETAKNLIGQLKDLDDKSAFSFDTYAKGAQKLMALGMAADQVVPTLTAIGDASAALGQGEDGIDRIVLALSQMTAKGKVSAQEMNQLAENNVQGWRYLAEATGKTQAEIMKMAEQGMINGAAAVQVILAGMEKDYKGTMDRMANETPIVWNTIVSSARQILAGVGPAIDKAFGINKTLQSVRDYLVKFKKGLDQVKGSALSVRFVIDQMIPQGAQMAIVAIAGAITGAAVLAFKSMALAAAEALVALAPYIVIGAAVAAAIWLLWKPISTVVDYLGQFEIVCVAAKAALAALAVGVGLLGIQAIIPSILTGATALGGFAAAAWAAVAPLLPFIGIVAGVAAIAYVVMKAWKPVGDLFKGVWDLAISWTQSAWANILVFVMTGVTRVLRAIQPIAKVFGGAVEKSISGFLGNAEQSLDKAKQAAEQAGTQGKNATAAIARAWKETGQAVAGSFGSTQKTIRDTSAMARQETAKTVDTVKSASANTPPLITSGSTDKELQKVQDKAKQVSESIEREWVQTTQTELQQLDLWKAEQLAALAETKTANQNYQRDVERVMATYSVRRRKIVQDEARAAADIWDQAADSANELKNKLAGIGLTGTDKERFDLETSVTEQITSIERKYRDLAAKFKSATQQEQAEYQKAWTANGIAFEIAADGTVSFAKQTAAERNAVEKQAASDRLKISRDERKAAQDIWDEARDKAKEYQRRLDGLGLQGVDKQKFDIENDAADQIEAIKRNYRDLAIQYNESTETQKAQFRKAWEENGVQFEITTGGMVDFAKQAAAEEIAVEQWKQQQIADLRYDYAKHQDMLDQARRDGNLAAIQEELNQERALMAQDLAGRQALIDTYYTIWQAAHRTATDYMAQATSGMYDGLTGFFEDVINNAESIGDAWQNLKNNVLKMLGQMVAQWLASRAMMWVQEKIFGVQQQLQAAAQGAATAAAWAPAAAAVSLATMGANAAPAMAGIAATNALSASLASLGGFSTGGQVAGAGTATSDSIFARLSDGEYVIQASAVRKFGSGFFDALNTGKMPAFATGGLVTGPPLATVGQTKYLEALAFRQGDFDKDGPTGGASQPQGDQYYITIKAWDGPDVDRWLQNGGGAKIVRYVKKHSRSFAEV